MKWIVIIAYQTGNPSTLKFAELDKAMAFVKDACDWMDISKATRIVIEKVNT